MGARLSGMATGLPSSLDGALAIPRWATVAALLVLIGVVLARRPLRSPCPAAWPWAITGLALGAVGVLAWTTGSVVGWGWGLSMTGPARSLVDTVWSGTPSAADWGTAMIVGVPLGAWLSAWARGPVTWRWPGWAEGGRRAAGGILMGVGGTLAAGCNIGNALTGVSVLAVNSVLATIAMAAGIAGTLAAARLRRSCRP